MRICLDVGTVDQARHPIDLLVIFGRQPVEGREVETVVIDFGWVDWTIAIADNYGCALTKILRDEYSFRHSLNRDCAVNIGGILVLVSGHCIPVGSDRVHSVCHAQIGGDDTNYVIAGSLHTAREVSLFDEALTRIEDRGLAKRLGECRRHCFDLERIAE
jgi:hypothetical protein